VSVRLLSRPVLTRWLLASALFCIPNMAHALSSEEVPPTTDALVTMEQKADQAAPRDQCFLYTELLQALAETESAQLRAGDVDGATATLLRMNGVATKMQAAQTVDSKHLKNAELLLERTTHRLNDMLHVVSSNEQTMMKKTLDSLNRMHEQMLALVFAR